jgi:hypothetical protein
MTDADFIGMFEEADWMNFKSGQFRIGFIEPEGIAVFSAGAPVGFRIIREALLVDLLLHLSRLLDLAGTGQRTNRSLQRAIVTLVERKLPAWVVVRLGADLDFVTAAFKQLNLESIRNKLVAHTDLSTSRGGEWPNVPVADIVGMCERVNRLTSDIVELATGNAPPILLSVVGEMTSIRNQIRMACKQLQIAIPDDLPTG